MHYTFVPLLYFSLFESSRNGQVPLPSRTEAVMQTTLASTPTHCKTIAFHRE